MEIFHDFDPGRILITSSFGTSSVFLLSLLHEARQHTKIYFIDTGYLFRETHRHMHHLRELLGLDIIMIKPDPAEHMITERKKTWQTDPDECCNVNKIKPLKKIIPSFDVWMTGLTGYQNDYRKNLQIFESNNILRFYPIIDVTRDELNRYLESRNLPEHPLAGTGFGSVGCTHCTVPGAGRNGRWANLKKTECGLHVKADR